MRVVVTNPVWDGVRGGSRWPTKCIFRGYIPPPIQLMGGAAADLMVQEYGRYYGMQTVCFRPNCITGPNHAGVELHGFLNYLMKCATTGNRYKVFGYDGKQVRDNIHAKDLVRAFGMWYDDPSEPGQVYNIGGGHYANCSILEAIEIAERVTGREMNYTIEPEARKGDHIWWITDNSKFQARYPDWKPTYTIEQLCQEIYDQNKERWLTAVRA